VPQTEKERKGGKESMGLTITCSYQIVVDEKRAKIRGRRQSDQPAERSAV